MFPLSPPAQPPKPLAPSRAVTARTVALVRPGPVSLSPAVTLSLSHSHRVLTPVRGLSLTPPPPRSDRRSSAQSCYCNVRGPLAPSARIHCRVCALALPPPPDSRPGVGRGVPHASASERPAIGGGRRRADQNRKLLFSKTFFSRFPRAAAEGGETAERRCFALLPPRRRHRHAAAQVPTYVGCRGIWVSFPARDPLFLSSRPPFHTAFTHFFNVYMIGTYIS